MTIKPELKALVLADHVYTDRATGKKVIAGTFNTLSAHQFPTSLGRLSWAYICLTGIRSAVAVRLRYVDLSSNKVLLESAVVPVKNQDPLRSVELVVEIPPLPMPRAGAFALEVYVDDVLIGTHRISVEYIRTGKDEKQ